MVGKENESQNKEIDPLTLEVISGPFQGQVFDKKGKKFSVGRTKNNSIYLKDPEISQHHAEVAWNGSTWEVRDKGSSNGTALNGMPLKEGERYPIKGGGPPPQPLAAAIFTRTSERYPIKGGDVIKFGCSSEVRVKIALPEVGEEDLNVEQYLTSQCDWLGKELKGKMEGIVESLWDDFSQVKADLERHTEETIQSGGCHV
eukprot:CAMPEP_0197867588 /NCGR_PEP_ID=MMETSP1438-20131217/44837_1 /TAXON_ID=1461541 /ORGANISM="Pterosperma sp., Strain CCMP1384" /LENGTH=200 /DNA_ID=CAMNT_0043486249 /DNA_START=283 /DNA_END=884 /DNA_ORIENTATION=+